MYDFLCQNDLIFTKIFELRSLYDKMFQYSQTVYTLKVLLSKNWLYLFFFSSSEMQNFRHLIGCHAIIINYPFNSLLSALHFSNILSQTKSVTREKIKTTSLTKKLF